MKGMELPDLPDLLDREEYWTEEIFFRFIEHCNEVTFENPRKGLEISRHAPALASKVAPRSRRPALIHLTAHGVLASAFRAVGDLREAEKSYVDAMAYGFDLSDLEIADLKRRMAYLRRDQRRFTEALELVDDAIWTYRRDGDLTKLHFLGCCYLARGTIHWENGNTALSILDLSEALNHIEIKRDPKVYHSAVHNLHLAIHRCRDPRAFGKTLKHLKRAQQRIPYRYKGRHMAKAKLQWAQGLIHNRFGSTRHGERLLYRARGALIELGALQEVVLISLDLELFYLEEGRPAWEIEALAAETYKLCRDLSADQDALAALAIWRHAAAEGELTAEIVHEVRETIVRLMQSAKTPQKENP